MILKQMDGPDEGFFVTKLHRKDQTHPSKWMCGKKHMLALTGNYSCIAEQSQRANVCARVLSSSIFSFAWIFRTRGHEPKQLPKQMKESHSLPSEIQTKKQTRKTTARLFFGELQLFMTLPQFHSIYMCLLVFCLSNSNSIENPFRNFTNKQVYKWFHC